MQEQKLRRGQQMQAPLTQDDLESLAQEIESNDISKEEYEQWLNNKVTKNVFDQIKLEEARSVLAIKTSPGNVIGITPSQDIMVGRIQGYNWVLDLSYEDDVKYEH